MTAPAALDDELKALEPLPEREPERELNAIAHELGTLAATLAATTCRFLLLLAEFDRREGWAGQGVSSATHWLSWRCGMSTTTAREQVRVARKLEGLPRTVEEFAAGRLSYSKVRAITRVATAETESELLAVAAAATANQLDRFVAGVATVASVDDVNARHSSRYLSFRTEADGSVTFSGRCSPEDGAVILERLRLVQDYLRRTAATDPEHTTDSTPAPCEEREVVRGRALIDALVLVCEEPGVGNAEEPTTADEAIGSRRSETVLHVTLDELTEAAATGQSRNASAEAVDARPSASAEAVDPRPGASAEAPNPDQAVRIGPRLEMGPALHPSTARRLCCDTGLLLSLHKETRAVRAHLTAMPNARPGRTLNLGRRRRLASRAQLRALWDRDHGCRFPGCERRRHLHAHHIVHWADGGRTDLDNLVLLCGQHHRLLHEGEYTLALRGATVTIYDNKGHLVPAVPRAFDPAPALSPSGLTAGTRTGDPLPLDPVNGGPLELEYAVGVATERWQLRSVG
ncbi:HNH endonuclease signature motif containing protein [Pseudactinotalea suaedae]|uniref:HNH endonuclease signature motif containing protein n=1 Tax=Pseudactinotalea suaedae TaxID=1524924 RepID=UPI0013916B1D|nr:HNH endonuclease signature motif containing protein [Pseudactinotalea suaedae]